MFGLTAASRYSLRLQYVFFMGIVGLFILAALTLTSYTTYSSFRTVYAEEISMQGQEVQHVFDEKVSFIEHFLQFIGVQIRNAGTDNLKNISAMITYHSHEHLDDAITWNIVDYITSTGCLVADSQAGIRHGIDLSKKRDWLTLARMEPWKLHFSTPGIGYISGDYILPSGIGIYDDTKKKLVGFLSSSISIEKLATSLIHLVNEYTAFVLLDDSFNVILISDPFLDAAALRAHFMTYKEKFTANRASNTTVELKEYLHVDNIVFSHYIHSAKFPFWFILGYDSNFYYRELWGEITPKLIANLLMWLIFSGILAYLSYQVVRPIVMLGKAADDISHGRSVSLTRFRAQELNILAKQLNTISRIHSTLRSKQSKLAKTNIDLSSANEFIKSNMSFLSHELINPTTTIVEFAKMLKLRVEDKIDIDSKEYLLIVGKAASHLNKQLHFFMELFKFQAERKSIEEKPILLKQLVDWNVSMITHHTKYKNVKVIVDVPSELMILGDEIMVGQLIQNIAANGAKYNKVDGTLCIRAFVNNKHEIEVHFIDSGVGIGEADLKHIFKIFKRAAPAKRGKTVGYGIGLTYAQKCIEAHAARILVSSKLGKGTTFKVIFPKSRTLRVLSKRTDEVIQ